MIKKFIIALAFLTIFIIQVGSGAFTVVRTTTDFVETEVGPVPIQYTLGDVLHGDNFYKDFTK